MGVVQRGRLGFCQRDKGTKLISVVGNAETLRSVLLSCRLKGGRGKDSAGAGRWCGLAIVSIVLVVAPSPELYVSHGARAQESEGKASSGSDDI